jgi:hypothetical protein
MFQKEAGFLPCVASLLCVSDPPTDRTDPYLEPERNARSH